MIRTRYFFILLFTIGLFASYYGSQLTGKTIPSKNEAAENLLEVYLIDSSSSKLDEKGLLQLTLVADTSQKFSLNKHMLLTNPRIGFYEQAQPWLLNADIANFNESSNTITLQDNVILRQQDDQIRLTTSVLFIDSKKQTATTEAAVNIRANNSNTDATGITINMQDETILLPANVNTSINPKGK